MQWSQIKTLFIICFLVLDVYLIFQFLEKREAADLSLFEPENATIEEKLEDENITIKQMPEAQPDETFLSVKQKIFSKSEQKQINKLSNQNVSIVDDKYIISQFKKPVQLDESESKETLSNKLRQQVFELDQYQYGEWDKDLHMILFFQVKNNRPIYYNSSGMIAIYLNDKNEAVAYAQSMLDKPESNKDKKTLIKPIEAVGKLYDNNQLISGDEVSQIRIGYHTVVPLTNGVQVFVPTWKVTVNDKRSYFVNAIEGAVISNDDNDFLKEIVQFTDNKLSQISDDKSMRKDLHKMLLDKLKLLNGGEEQ